jgi:hypothetical protein
MRRRSGAWPPFKTNQTATNPVAANATAEVIGHAAVRAMTE